jgi:phage major head subunit gpT-like protein
MSANKGLSSRAIIGSFYNRLNVLQAASWVEMLGMKFQSDQESETYKWLGQSPAMREWIGARDSKGFAENGITITNKLFEATLGVPVDWLRRDKTGQLQVRIDEMAARTVTHWQSLLSTLILNAGSTVCYDGQYFFDTDHTEAANTTNQSNAITVDISTIEASPDTPSAPTPKQMQGMVMGGVEKILGFKDDQNEPMNEMARKFLVMVPTTLFKNAAAALGNPLVGGGDTNLLTSLDGYTFGLAVNPRLTWTDKIAVFRTDGSTKPFILQEEQGVVVDAIAEGSELEFRERRHEYGVTAIRNAGYGYWQHAVQVQAV